MKKVLRWRKWEFSVARNGKVVPTTPIVDQHAKICVDYEAKLSAFATSYSAYF